MPWKMPSVPQAMVAAVQGGTPFNEAAQAAQDEESAENFKDEEYNHVTDLLGQNIDNTYKAWLQDEARTVGEVTSLETSAGYCVVQFLGREKSEDTYQTINYRNILVLSETTDTEVPVTDASAVTDGTADEAASTETETVSLPSAEQLAAAEEEANSLLEQFESGEQTAESFAALATANSDDEVTSANGGLTENANRDSLSSDLTEWLFAADRKAGDTTILDYKDSSGRVVGYQILYVDSLGDIAWRYAATTALQADDYQAWYTEVEGNYPAELTEKGKTIAGTPNVAEDAEAAEGLIEREYKVLCHYQQSELWQEAWQRYYRMIFRDSFNRLQRASFDIYNALAPYCTDETDLAQKLLTWTQGFSYERKQTASDFANLPSMLLGGGSDCDSRAMLLGVLLKNMNMETVMFVSAEFSHALAGFVSTHPGHSFTVGDKEFLMGETTAAGVTWGMIAKDMDDQGKWITVEFP